MTHMPVKPGEAPPHDGTADGFEAISLFLDRLTVWEASDSPADVVAALLREARDYFVREEALMDLCPGYGDAFSHRFAHSTFLFRLEGLAAQIGQSGAIPAADVAFARSWWHHHAEESDRRLCDRLERQFSAVALAAE